MIRFENISKQFPGGTAALSHIDLNIERGEIAAVCGPLGSGKSTLLKLVNRLLEPTEGKIYLAGEDVSAVPPVELRRNIGYVIQQIGFLPKMATSDNNSLVPKLRHFTRDEFDNRVEQLMNTIGIDPHLHREGAPAEYECDLQQRIGIIRTFAAEPSLILMDEPFTALDSFQRRQLQQDLLMLQRKIRKTILFATDDSDEAIRVADRIFFLEGGTIREVAEMRKRVSPEPGAHFKESGFISRPAGILSSAYQAGR